MSETPLTPTLDTTRRAIIDVLVKNQVIGAREAVDRLIYAVRAEERQQRDALRSELVRAEAIIAAWVGEDATVPQQIRAILAKEQP